MHQINLCFHYAGLALLCCLVVGLVLAGVVSVLDVPSGREWLLRLIMVGLFISFSVILSLLYFPGAGSEALCFMLARVALATAMRRCTSTYWSVSSTISSPISSSITSSRVMIPTRVSCTNHVCASVIINTARICKIFLRSLYHPREFIS